MKKFAWVLGTILLALTVLTVSCAKPAPATTPATTTPAEAPNVTSVQGTLGEVDAGESTVTVQTGQGEKSFKVTADTSLTLMGQTCSLAQLEELQASGQDFDCTAVYDDEGNLAALNVYKISQPASSRGTISDVNITDSTITVKTGSGDVVYDVDPATGLIIGGVACSLALLDELLAAGAELPCTVIYDTDEKGTARYIDIANPPNLTQSVGTITTVDIEKSTVTIMTDKGERTFEVDAKTGQFLNGEVCSLEDVEQATELGDSLGSCKVIYYTDKDGKPVYIDISQSIPTP